MASERYRSERSTPRKQLKVRNKPPIETHQYVVEQLEHQQRAIKDIESLPQVTHMTTVMDFGSIWNSK
jgi:hypothetical protein